MCVIIDTNVFGDVFNKESKSYFEFEPIKKWILEGKGKIVYGGSKYKKELEKAFKYLKLVNELAKKNKTVKLDDSGVDEWENKVRGMKQRTNFNDEHLVAMVIVSGCRLICTKDSSAAPFLKDPVFYRKPVKKPKIYSGSQNKNLLKDCNIAAICKERKSRNSL